MKRTKKNHRKLVIYAMIFGLISAVGYSLSKMQSNPSQVALVSTDASCVSNISSFAANGTCGAQGFSGYSYSCLNGPSRPLESSPDNACIDFTQAFAKAAALCGATCAHPSTSPISSRLPIPSRAPVPPSPSLRPAPSPTPPPSPSTTPTPTPVPCYMQQPQVCLQSIWGGTCAPTRVCPSPSLTPTPTPTHPSTPSPRPTPPSPVASAYNPYACNIQVYKLRPQDTLVNLNLLITPDRQVDHGSHRVRPGDRYLYEVVAINNSLSSATPSTLSAVTSNVHGFNEPIRIQAVSSDCRAETTSKFMDCNQRNLTVPANSSKLTNMNMVVEIQPEIAQTYNTSTLFSVGWAFGNTYWQSTCGVMMLVDNTATPSPTPSPGCYYQEPMMCIQLFGYECKPKMVCPSPSVKPSSSPFASSPTSSVAPSKQPVAIPSSMPVPKQRCYQFGPLRYCRQIKN